MRTITDFHKVEPTDGYKVGDVLRHGGDEPIGDSFGNTVQPGEFMRITHVYGPEDQQ